MSQSTPADRSILDAPIEDGQTVPHPDREMDEDREADVRLATHLRALSRVSHATAHDIRTPLHTVVLYLELLRNTVAEQPSAEQRTRQERYVEVIRGELQQLEDMLESLLVQTRVAEGKVERFDLAESLRGVVGFLGPHQRKSRIELRWTPASQPVPVEAERDSVRHALVHLLVLAIEATPEGEELAVEVSAADGRAVVAISGTGVADGPATVLADGSDRAIQALSRVVARHRGTIKVRSGASGAATLEIQLPLAAAADR